MFSTYISTGCNMKEGLRGGISGWHTARQVDSIPDAVIGVFRWHNLSGHTMALGSTQPLTEKSTRDIGYLLGEGVKAAGA